MEEDLPVHRHVEVVDLDLTQLPARDGVLHGKRRQEGDALVLLHETDQHLRVSGLEERMDLHALRREVLLQRIAVVRILLREEEAEIDEIRETYMRHRTDTLLARDRHLGARHEDDRLRLLQNLHPVLIVDTTIQEIYYIHEIMLEHIRELLRGSRLDLQRDLRMLLVEVADDVRNLIGQQRLERTDAQLMLLHLRVAERCMHIIYAPEDFIGILQKLPAWWGQHDATTDTIEETSVELLLQLTDLDRHGRLGVAERLCRLRKALHLYDFYKRSQLTNFHKGILSFCYRPRRAFS